MDDSLIIKALGGGLVMRHATPADADKLAPFNERMHEEMGIDAWTRMLLSGRHPAIAPGDTLIVEDTASGLPVSSLALMSQRWLFGGVEIAVGRIELVATEPQYRRRGLVRELMNAAHRISAARGELMQGITGIPNYYRQFGYEMALTLEGWAQGYEANLPALPEGESEPFNIRAAGEADLGFISDLYRRSQQRYLVSTQRDEALFRYELFDKGAKAITTADLRIIETPQAEPVGFFATHPYPFYRGLHADAYELKPGYSFFAVTPSVLRWLWAQGAVVAAEVGKTRSLYGLILGDSHPAYQALPECTPNVHPPYSWYVRVPDLPAFVRGVAPVLEQRMAESPLVWGYSGTLRISFYTSGLELVFERGRLADARGLAATDLDNCVASFPGLTFLQALFGHRAPAELKPFYPDLWWNDNKAGALLRALFPRLPSLIWPVD